jgi:hypothetical protein
VALPPPSGNGKNEPWPEGENQGGGQEHVFDKKIHEKTRFLDKLIEMSKILSFQATKFGEVNRAGFDFDEFQRSA